MRRKWVTLLFSLNYILFVFVIIVVHPSFSQNIEAQTNFDYLIECEFYHEIELKLKCGKRGYAKKIGEKYCKKILKNRGKFSDEGKIWVDNTMSCLIEVLSEIENANFNCKKLKKIALASHVPCFIKNGYCDLSRKDKKMVFKLVKSTLFKPRFFWSGIKIKMRCVI